MLALVLTLAAGQAAATPPGDAAAGAKVYAARCAQCHGETGEADGPAADRSYPRPRVFKENARYKLRTTPSGALPTADDMFKVVTNGLPGSSMPGFASLPEADRWNVVAYIRTLAEEFADPDTLKDAVPMAELTKAPPPVDLERGKKAFAKAECHKCHGKLGRGDGPSWQDQKDEWGVKTPPRNFWNFDRFRRGSERLDIFTTLSTGLDGSPMSSFSENVSVEDRWAIADYVGTLRPKLDPSQADSVFARRVERAPEGATDEAWKDVGVARVAMFPNVVEPPRLFWAAVEFVYVQAVYTSEALTLRLQWDDRTRSAGTELTGEYADGDTTVYQGTPHPDQLAVQFPARGTDRVQRPYFLFGDARRPVSLWWWRSSEEGPREWEGKGPAALKVQPDAAQALKGSVSYEDGRYTLVLSRPLVTPDAARDVQFEPGATVPLAFHVWDGSSGEVGLRGALSTWSWLVLEPQPKLSTFAAPPGVFGVTLLGLLFAVRRVRNRRGKTGGPS